MSISPIAWAENPYCQLCLEERVSKANAQVGSMEWYRTGSLIALRPKNQA
jgi:hypothetical protein